MKFKTSNGSFYKLKDLLENSIKDLDIAQKAISQQEVDERLKQVNNRILMVQKLLGNGFIYRIEYPAKYGGFHSVDSRTLENGVIPED